MLALIRCGIHWLVLVGVLRAACVADPLFVDSRSAEPLARLQEGENALSFACVRSHLPVIKFLIGECKMDPDFLVGVSEYHLTRSNGWLSPSVRPATLASLRLSLLGATSPVFGLVRAWNPMRRSLCCFVTIVFRVPHNRS